MSDFEKQIHAMFDHVWDCDINHPIFEDTVGELMDAVIQCYNNLPPAEPRKKGKWIFIHPLQADDEGAYICSNCHRGDWDIKPTDKYCKFCEMEMDIYER